MVALLPVFQLLEQTACKYVYLYIELLLFMRSSLVVRASDCQCTSCNGPGFDPSIRRHSGIWGAADEAVLNIVRKKKKYPPPKKKKYYFYLSFIKHYLCGVII